MLQFRPPVKPKRIEPALPWYKGKSAPETELNYSDALTTVRLN